MSTRDRRSIPGFAEPFVQVVRYGLRVLRKNPGHTLTAPVTPALAAGATRAGVVALTMRQGMTRAPAGVALGAGGALALDRLIQSLLFATPGADSSAFFAVSCLLVAVAARACLIPSLAAAAVYPALTLRRE